MNVLENASISLLIPGGHQQALVLLSKIAAYALSLGHGIEVLEAALDVNESAACNPIWLGVYGADAIRALAAGEVEPL